MWPREMTRGFAVPLLIGGATTSQGPYGCENRTFVFTTVHVLDASRAVGVVGSLINAQQGRNFPHRCAPTISGSARPIRNGDQALMSLEAARTASMPTGGQQTDLPTPSFTGVRHHRSYALRELVPFIDWTPFFHTWELRGRYPGIWRILRSVRSQGTAGGCPEALLAEIIRDDLLTARGSLWIFPANSVGDDIELYRDLDRQERRDHLSHAPADGETCGSVQPGFGRLCRIQGVWAYTDYVGPSS